MRAELVEACPSTSSGHSCDELRAHCDELRAHCDELRTHCDGLRARQDITSRAIGQDMQRGPPRPEPSSDPAIGITSIPASTRRRFVSTLRS